MANSKRIIVLGAYVSDATFRAERMPKLGETIIGQSFKFGPGGKGSNQAVASARLGSNVSFISRLGDDAFAKMAYELWKEEGVEPLIVTDLEKGTGSACIYVDTHKGSNAITIVPGAALNICAADIEQFKYSIQSGSIFIAQLETPLDATIRALEISRQSSLTTILNPAPAVKLDRQILSLVDYLIPNEIEAELLTGIEVKSIEDARVASVRLIDLGCHASIITLGEKGALFNNGQSISIIPAPQIREVIDTTGAGDCFCGAFAHAMLQNLPPLEAVQFACNAAAISTTQQGAANSMPSIDDVNNLINFEN
ncbi:MAG: ribokinase [Rhodobacteraceae bacterium]|nr:ribokinase [Paracoccaceae bacterium]